MKGYSNQMLLLSIPVLEEDDGYGFYVYEDEQMSDTQDFRLSKPMMAPEENLQILDNGCQWNYVEKPTLKSQCQQLHSSGKFEPVRHRENGDRYAEVRYSVSVGSMCRSWCLERFFPPESDEALSSIEEGMEDNWVLCAPKDTALALKPDGSWGLKGSKQDSLKQKLTSNGRKLMFDISS
eukprot:CAMPEP_0113938656 /NCGR_PEP_ID=MMETSP1339-20121228/5076_1 /TAXON_ID=94617 /ORGANISM="Fibrocapsa japonica" /LENGTH=179 /DNA_ID=CAMNT_0000941875 /DNA_START=26 /DNA_END=565 /DNA_ORIENTATION=+ /assembly_acc=CAM_ASM_000762